MRKAARDKIDSHECMFSRPPPHVGGALTTGTRKVLVNGQEAATYGDEGECTGIGGPPPKNSIKGGNLRVFIGGNPAARERELTFSGCVLTGSDNVYHNDAPGPLSEAAANWLLQYLAQDKNNPFAYGWDGCYKRAEIMRHEMEDQFGVQCKKIFVYGDLKPATGAVHGDPFDGWGYHVAPLVDGVDAQGRPTQWVMDPSLSPNTVTTKDEWKRITTGSGTLDRVEIKPGDTYTPGRRGYTKDNGQLDSAIDEYRRKLAAGERIDPDPALSSKVSAKASFPPPIVHPPHVP